MSDQDETSWLWVPVQPKSLLASNDPNRNLGKRTMWVCGDVYRAPSPELPIVSIWQSTIIPTAGSIVDANAVPMTSLNLIQRVQPEGEIWEGEKAYDPCTLLWIGVEKEEMSPEQAEDLVAQCSEMLKAHSIEDVRVEVHASPVLLYGGPQFLPAKPYWRDVYKYELPFQLGIGWPLASPAENSAGGTGAVFLKLADHPETYLLSAGHALNGGKTLDHPTDPTKPGQNVLLMGNQHFLDHLDLINGELEEIAHKIEWKTEILSTIGKSDPEEAKLITLELNILNYEQREMKNLCSKLQEDWSREEDRRIGTVSYRSRIASDSVTTHLEDWTLIRLNDNIVPDGVSPNILRLGERIPFRSGFTLDPSIEDRRIMQVSNTVPMSEYEGSRTPCMMSGAANGVKIGIIHPVMALVRNKSEHGTRDSLVIPISASDVKEKKFSGPGDSGTIVVNEKGGAVAMVVGGVSQFRVTYASPLEHIFESIENLTGFKPRLA
jgi:hypothetical protein